MRASCGVRPCDILLVVVAFALAILADHRLAAESSLADVVAHVQPKIVKIFGAGGLRGLEHYQSGFLISAKGHILTAASYVLETEDLSAILDDGRRQRAEVLGTDPQLEIAVLKIEAVDLPCFQLAESVALEPGDRVLAFSNLFGVATGNEHASVLHGFVAARTPLAARRGVYQTPYRGPVYVLDAVTNNPGSAGGALTDRHGRLAGLLGKELRSLQDNTWLNYAIPVAEIEPAVREILAGKVRPRVGQPPGPRPREPVSLSLLGLVLVPDVLARTPPFVDRVIPGSPADKAGLRPDDLLLLVNGRPASSVQAVAEELSHIDRIDEVRITAQRGQDLLEVSLFAGSP